jgi:hypothetical protein
MGYRIQGLDRARFAHLFGLADEELESRGTRRVKADSERGYPCRIGLDHAAPGESLLLLNHVSLDVPTPFRTAYAIFVREDASEPALHVNALPPVLTGRTLSLRGFDGEGMLRTAALAGPGEVEDAIPQMFADKAVASIHAHNAAYGCFLARIERG